MFIALAASCGPWVHVDTLAAIARAESDFDSVAIHDNTGQRRYRPRSRGEAIALATELIAQRHSVDLGLMQINSANFPALGLTLADAFDPCKSIAAGARVLLDGWRPIAGEAAQLALLRALSHYNTGSPQRGFANGYVRRVQTSAEAVVPAIRLAGAGEPVRQQVLEPAAPASLPPPAWDVFGQARYARERGTTTQRSGLTASAGAPRELIPPGQLHPASRIATDALERQAAWSRAPH